MMPRATSRRSFLRGASLGLAALSSFDGRRAFSAEGARLGFANGDRPLVRYPGKRALIEQTVRPPQLETPFSVYDEGVLTPNDAFFVRYHLAGVPLSIDPKAFRLEVRGHVETPLSLSLADAQARLRAGRDRRRQSMFGQQPRLRRAARRRRTVWPWRDGQRPLARRRAQDAARKGRPEAGGSVRRLQRARLASRRRRRRISSRRSTSATPAMAK